MSGAIVLHHLRMLDRKIGDPLLEAERRVTAGPHHFVDQLVGGSHRDGRVVDEPLLNLVPALGEATPVSGAEISKTKVLDAFGTRRKLALGSLGAAQLLDRAIVFGSESLMELKAPRVGSVTSNGENDDDCHRRQH